MHWSTAVRNLMTPNPVSIDIDARPSDVAALLEGNPFNHLPVVDKGVLVGIVSSIDLARVSLGSWVQDGPTQRAWLDERFAIKDLMTWEPAAVRDDTTVRKAAEELAEGSYHALPVLDEGGKLVGILTSTDLLRYLATA